MSAFAEELRKAELRRLGEIRSIATYRERRDALLQLPTPKLARGLLHHASWDAILAAPLFYDQPVIDVCANCDAIADGTTLRWMADHELVIPMLHSPFGSYPGEFLSTISGGPHISIHAKLALMSDYAHAQGQKCFCRKCTGNKVSDFSRLKPSIRSILKSSTVPNLSELPSEIQREHLERLNNAILKRSDPEIKAESRRIASAAFLAEADAISAIPQVAASASVQPDPAGFTLDDTVRSLGIAYSPTMDRREYAQIIRDYKGRLSPLVSGIGDAKKALADLEKVNEEVRSLESSKRLSVVEIGGTIFRKDTRPVIAALVAGTIGAVTMGPWAAVACGAGAPVLEHSLSEMISAGADAMSQSRLGVRATAMYFGKSIESVHVWRIRRALDAKRGADAAD